MKILNTFIYAETHSLHEILLNILLIRNCSIHRLAKAAQYNHIFDFVSMLFGNLRDH